MKSCVRGTTNRAGRLIGLAVAGALLSSCGIVESQRMAFDAPPPGGTHCASRLGSYALPKAFLQVKVTQTGDAAPELATYDANGRTVNVVRHPDPALVFCLDYLSSPTSHDVITVEKAPRGTDQSVKTPYLGAVLINASDRTVTIVRTLLRAFAILVTGQVGFQPASLREAPVPTVTLAELEYDPFDPRDSAMVNARLSRLGYCLVLERFTFDTQRFHVQQYCSDPERYGAVPTMVTKAYVAAQAEPADPNLPGLLYRARHAYRLSIYRKRDPGGRAPWLLTQMVNVEMENFSPVLALDIHRTLFNERNINFVFDNGVLTAACISKTSEVEAFVEIPLAIAKSIVAVPGAIFTVRIDRTNKMTDLVNAEAALYRVQQAHLNALASGTYQTPNGVAIKKPDTSLAVPAAAALPADVVYTPTALTFGDRASVCGVTL